MVRALPGRFALAIAELLEAPGAAQDESMTAIVPSAKRSVTMSDDQASGSRKSRAQLSRPMKVKSREAPVSGSATISRSSISW